MSSAGWFIVLLALICANLPFLNQRLFALIPLTRTMSGARKPAWLRLIELIVFYCVVIGLGRLLEARAGNVFVQGWQFYAVSLSLFAVAAFPGFTIRYLVKKHH
jgi:hypothetical protein